MSYHIAFLSPRFQLACIANDTRASIHQGEKRIVKDGIAKVEAISDFAWLSYVGLLPFAWLYRDWLKGVWQREVISPKVNPDFLNEKKFLDRSRSFCQNELGRLRKEYQSQRVPHINENIHIVLGGINKNDEPFFLAINNGGGESFSHTVILARDGELPHVYPAEDRKVLTWVQHGFAAIQKAQSVVDKEGEFLKRVRLISAQVFRQISELMRDVSDLCDIVAVNPSGSTKGRFRANRSLTSPQ